MPHPTDWQPTSAQRVRRDRQRRDSLYSYSCHDRNYWTTRQFPAGRSQSGRVHRVLDAIRIERQQGVVAERSCGLQPWSNDKIFGRVKFDRGVQPTYTDSINPVFNDLSIQPQDEGQLNYTHVFSPTVVNNFIFSDLWYSAIFGSLGPGPSLALFPGNLAFSDGSLTALGTSSGNPGGFAAGFDTPKVAT